MTYTIEQLLTIDLKIFATMKTPELKEIQEQLKAEKKDRTKQFIKPAMDKNVKPIMDSQIKPLKEEHLKPIDKVLKELKTYLKKKPAKAYITINGKRFGPFSSKKEIAELITEDEEDEDKEE